VVQVPKGIRPRLAGILVSAVLLALVVGLPPTVSAQAFNNIELVGQLTPTGTSSFVSVQVRGNYAFLGGSTFNVADISDPTNPTLVATLDIPVGSFVVAGDFIYSVGGAPGFGSGPGLRIIDIRNPRSPTLASFLPLGRTLSDIAVSGGRAYVTESDHKLWIINVNDPSAPGAVREFSPGLDDEGQPTPGEGLFGSIDVSGGLAYIGQTSIPCQGGTNGVSRLNVLDPGHLVWAGHVRMQCPVDIEDGLVADGDGGVRTLDGGLVFDTPGWVADVAVRSGHILVADAVEGLYVDADFAHYDPAPDPNTNATLASVDGAGDYVYVALLGSLQVLRLGTPAPTTTTTSSTTTTTTLPEPPTIGLRTDRTQVWANGHEQAVVTASVTDSGGDPLPGRSVALTGIPSNGLLIDPPGGTTNAQGEVQFTVRSTQTQTNPVELTAVAAGTTKSVSVEFIRRKVVAQFQGINTTLSCNAEGVCGAEAPDGFRFIRTALGSVGFQPRDFLWYSYRGGDVDRATGRWRANSYGCNDPAQSYDASMEVMRRFIHGYLEANPNTDLYLVGHSQGGLIAFQELGAVGEMPPTSRVVGIITLDSPLGGAPRLNVDVAKLMTCWDDPAASELIDLYNSVPTGSHQRQGSLAAPLCCNGTNRSLVSRTGVRVYTWGNLDDAVYRPRPACGLAGVNTPSTQIVDTAASGPPSAALRHHGGNIGSFGACVSSSHGRIFEARSASVATVVGRQHGA
jgi:pimeloyl-ACP methyl ester carboxylesterase